MKRSNFDPEEILDRGVREIREEVIDPRTVELSRRRSWTALSRELSASSHVDRQEASPVAETEGSMAEPSAASGRIEGCAGYLSLMPDYIEGRLAPARVLLLEDHTHECVACRAALKSARTGLTADSSSSPRQGSVRAMPALAERRSFAMPRWGLAVAASAAIVLGGLAVFKMLAPVDGGGPQTVQSVDGALYKVSASALEPLGSGAQLASEDLIRTAKGSRAVVRLADGSLVEMAERSEIVLPRPGTDSTIRLPRGQIIVQAAKRTSGHLYVATEDATVAVVGTIFSVNHGVRGSRVTVIEGEVRVDQGGKEQVLRPGDQVATQPSLERVPLAEEIAWSGDVDRYLALIGSLAAIRRNLEETITAPGLRTSTRLLDLMPEGTVVYGAIPNVTAALAEAHRRIQAEIENNQVLRDWMKQSSHGAHADDRIDRVLEEVRKFGDALGDEIAFSLQAGPDTGPEGILLLAEIRKPEGFDRLLASEVRKANWVVEGKGPLVLLDDADLARAVAEAAKDADAEEDGEPRERKSRRGRGSRMDSKLYLWSHGDILAAGSSPALIQGVSSGVTGAGTSGFAGSTFHQKVADVYREGAGWLFAADIEALLTHARHEDDGPGERSAAALERTGLLDARHLILDVREQDGRTDARAVLTFDQTRRGLVSWLAAPATMGSLAFISPDASLAAAFVVKEPALVVDDLYALIGADNPNFAAEVSRFESESGVSIRDDLAGPLGGEFAIALDGPVLPIPGWRFVVEVYDPSRLQETIGRMIATFNAKAAERGKAGLSLGSEESGGRTWYVIGSSDSPMAFHYTYIDGYLVAAPQKSQLERAIQNHESGYTLEGSTAFRDLFPADATNGFSAVFYQNGSGLFGQVARRIAGSRGLTAAQERTVDSLAADVPNKLAVAYAEDNRIVFQSSGRGTFVSNFGSVVGLPGGEQALAQAFGQALRSHGDSAAPRAETTR